jgi:predicted glycosyl hydrolase (DUF1957 family)
MAKLKLNVMMDEDFRDEVFKLIDERLRPLTREYVNEHMSEKLVEKVVAQVITHDLVRAIAQELRFHVAKDILRQPDILRAIERLDHHAESAVEKALQDKNLTPVINAAVKRALLPYILNPKA